MAGRVYLCVLDSVYPNTSVRYMYVIVQILPQAFKKMNKDLKREQIEMLKTKYGIDLEKDKK